MLPIRAAIRPSSYAPLLAVRQFRQRNDRDGAAGLPLVISEERVGLLQHGPLLLALGSGQDGGQCLVPRIADLDGDAGLADQVAEPHRILRRARVGGDDEQPVAVLMEHHRRGTGLAGLRPDRRQQDQPVPAHAVDLPAGPELLDELPVDLPIVQRPRLALVPVPAECPPTGSGYAANFAQRSSESSVRSSAPSVLTAMSAAVALSASVSSNSPSALLPTNPSQPASAATNLAKSAGPRSSSPPDARWWPRRNARNAAGSGSPSPTPAHRSADSTASSRG